MEGDNQSIATPKICACGFDIPEDPSIWRWCYCPGKEIQIYDNSQDDMTTITLEDAIRSSTLSDN